MYSFTGPLTINGSINVLATLVANGYLGHGFLKKDGTVLNVSSTVIAYIHFTSDGANAPGTGTDGIPIEAGSATIPAGIYTLPKGTDLATTWIYTPSSIVIKISVSS